jgi:flagellar biosynthesis protein FlhG
MSEMQSSAVDGSVAEQPVRVVAVASGKGGVGKTNVSVNLALSLAAQGQKVVLLDADLGLGNVDVLLGLYPTYNLSHVFRGEVTLEEVIVTGPNGLRIVPAGSGLKELTELSQNEHAGLISAFSELTAGVDTLVIDTGAGISTNVVFYARAAQEVVLIVCDEPASITDAYALAKVLSDSYGVKRFHVVANMVNDATHGRKLYEKLARVADRFLNVELDFMGAVPSDDYLRRAVRSQRAVVDAYPLSKSATAIRGLANALLRWPQVAGASGHVEFFVERLVGPGGTADGN